MTKNKSLDGSWVYEPLNPMGGAQSSAYDSLLSGTDLTAEQKLVREIIQNSNDARLKTQSQVNVEIYRQVKKGDDLSKMITALSLKGSTSPINRLDALNLNSDNSFERIANNGIDTEVQVTVFQDFATCGLGFSGGKNRFKSLLLDIGRNVQLENSSGEGAGGTYGMGSSILQTCSDVKTIVVYSSFQPCKDGNHECVTDPNVPVECNGESAKLMVGSFFKDHSYEGKKYVGRAWFGVPGEGSELCKPFVDEEAHDIGDKLGFDLRKEPHQIGTSIMVIGTTIDPKEIKKAVEDYWWPSLNEGTLSVELLDHQEDIEQPEPLKRNDLKPYIEAYARLNQDTSSNVEAYMFQFPKTGRTGDLITGKIALTHIDADPALQEEDMATNNLINSIALIRRGPKMVVQYWKNDNVGNPDIHYVGVFMNHPDAESVLQKAEPALHNEWNAHNDKLTEARGAGTVSSEEFGIIDTLYNKIRNQIRRFRRRIGAELPSGSTESIRDLERLLGQIISSRRPGRRLPPQNKPDDFSITYPVIKKIPNAETGKIQVEFEVSLSLQPGSNADEMDVNFEPDVQISIDDLASASESVGFENVWNVVGNSKEPLEEVSEKVFRLTINKQSATLIRARSEEFDRHLASRVSSRVTGMSVETINSN